MVLTLGLSCGVPLGTVSTTVPTEEVRRLKLGGGGSRSEGYTVHRETNTYMHTTYTDSIPIDKTHTYMHTLHTHTSYI